ncbi:MAG: hypothetical protein KAS32_12825 [Candidatus Peribacteraceae bacterium]|nr:hypothetical protein [Candidatus Peribacteraceae bacterium]
MRIAFHIFGSALLATIVLGAITPAYASIASEAINIVGGNLSTTSNGDNIGGIMSTVANAFIPLVNIIAIIVLIASGLVLIVAQDDNQVSTAKKTLLSVVAGLIGINIAGPLSVTLSTGFTDGAGGSIAASSISVEVLGIINFIEVPIASIAVIMIIVSGIRAIATFGTDQGNTHLKRTILAVGSGLVIIAAKMAITEATGANANDVLISGGPSSRPLVDLMVTIMGTVLGFMALAAVIVVVIAGIMLVANKGDQDVVDKSKNLIFRTIIGLIVIMISGGLVTIVIG